ncbi:MAG: hypothetical protein U1E87_01710 [Alphaproteobacteria bacterium]
MTDPFLQDLQQDWRRQDANVGEISRRLRRARFVPHLLIGLEILGGLVGFATGVLLLFRWIETGETLFLFATPVLLFGLPAIAIAAWRARRGSLRWEDETPESVLRTALARGEASLRAIQVGRLSVYTLAGFAVALWIAMGFGIIAHLTFVLWYSALCFLAATLTWGWLEFRTRRVRRQVAACRGALAQFEVKPSGPGQGPPPRS